MFKGTVLAFPAGARPTTRLAYEPPIFFTTVGWTDVCIDSMHLAGPENCPQRLSSGWKGWASGLFHSSVMMPAVMAGVSWYDSSG